LVAQGLRPVRQPAVPGPQSLREGVESVALLPELAELGAHLVEGAVPVAGAVLQLLPSIDEIHECCTAKTNTKTTRSKKKATTSYLENTPRRAAVNPQRLVQHLVERGSVITELLPQLLLLLGVGEVGGRHVDALLA
jgi:hypothetical protein